jgi:hypothetical protein
MGNKANFCCKSQLYQHVNNINNQFANLSGSCQSLERKKIMND